MIGDLFDSPWKVLILAVVILVLFGSRKLPDAARSLGKSMRILKTEIHDLHDGDDQPGAPVQQAPVTTTAVGPGPAGPALVSPTGPAAADAGLSQQEQMEQLQRQIDELRRQAAPADAAPQTHQAG